MKSDEIKVRRALNAKNHLDELSIAVRKFRFEMIKSVCNSCKSCVGCPFIDDKVDNCGLEKAANNIDKSIEYMRSLVSIYEHKNNKPN